MWFSFDTARTTTCDYVLLSVNILIIFFSINQLVIWTVKQKDNSEKRPSQFP